MSQTYSFDSGASVEINNDAGVTKTVDGERICRCTSGSEMEGASGGGGSLNTEYLFVGTGSPDDIGASEHYMKITLGGTVVASNWQRFCLRMVDEDNYICFTPAGVGASGYDIREVIADVTDVTVYQTQGVVGDVWYISAIGDQLTVKINDVQLKQVESLLI